MSYGRSVQDDIKGNTPSKGVDRSSKVMGSSPVLKMRLETWKSQGVYGLKNDSSLNDQL